jgi:hypothetical protein
MNAISDIIVAIAQKPVMAILVCFLCGLRLRSFGLKPGMASLHIQRANSSCIINQIIFRYFITVIINSIDLN